MKRFAWLGLLVALCAFGATQAQTFPNRTVTIVVPYPPGGGTDTVARSLAVALATHWGQSVIVENFSGADGMIGTQRVQRAAADGYMILMQVNQMLLSKNQAGGNAIDDFRLLSKIQTSPLSFVVPGNLPVTNFAEFTNWCKGNAKSCSWASATKYGHLIGRQLMGDAGLKDALQVSYKGTAPMINDLVGGHVKLALPAVPTALPLHRNGQLKVLAVGSTRRFPALPEVPTLVESGFQVFGESWYGLMVHKDTPEAVFNRIVEGVRVAAKDERLNTAIDKAGGVAVFGSPAEFKDDVRKEIEYLDGIAARYPDRSVEKQDSK